MAHEALCSVPHRGGMSSEGAGISVDLSVSFCSKLTGQTLYYGEFGVGNIVGARLDRLGLRPLRSVEAEEALAILAAQADYPKLLAAAQTNIDDLPMPRDTSSILSQYKGSMSMPARYVGYTHNQESFKFLMDPMLQTGVEKVSAMGYGNAINALSDNEGGVAKYFSQRFAQVTNPPRDSIREADGVTLRVALGGKPHLGQARSLQIVVNSPVPGLSDMRKIKTQTITPWKCRISFASDGHKVQKYRPP